MAVVVVSHHHHTRATTTAPAYLLHPSRARFAFVTSDVVYTHVLIHVIVHCASHGIIVRLAKLN